MTSLADACADLASWLPAASDLIAEPDTDGTRSHGKPGSKPPWNAAAAHAALDAHAGIRHIETAFRTAITGQPGPRRGGSDANTIAALDAIARLGEAVTTDAAAEAARILTRWATAIQQLPAIDQAERPHRVTAECPYCGFEMLRFFPRSGRVTCLRAGACEDADGNHPVGRLSPSALPGMEPGIEWADGLVT